MEHTTTSHARAWLVATLLAFGVVVLVVLAQRQAPPSAHVTASVQANVDQAAKIVRFKVPVTTSQPSLGPVDALVTIVEWCDLRGPVCRDAASALSSILQRYPTDVRLVHRHLFDRKNARAELVHHVAHGAHYHAGKFWELRSALLAIDEQTTLGLAELGALVENLPADWTTIEQGLRRMGYAQHVSADQVFAARFGVTTAPGIFVNGRRYAPDAKTSFQQGLQTLVDEERANANALVASGVARASVYETLTRDGLWNVGDDPSARAAATSVGP